MSQGRLWSAVMVSVLLTAGAAQGAAKRAGAAEKQDGDDGLEKSWAGLALRPIGPAIASGRVADLAVDPTDGARWLVGVASGGVWITENRGATWRPLFDGEGSFSIGAVAIDPHNPLVLWVGSGENNSQRSVAYGDGVYKSVDGGKTWTNVGLADSQHIGRILVDPRDSQVVWVAAQGPLWNAGGDRGLYKTTDGGKSWTQVLAISPDTGVSDIAFHPLDPDTLYATAYQRRRHVWTLVDGGPEGGIHKTADGGKSWKRVSAGLPEVDLGRIGLAVTPAAPDTVYAVVEAADGEGGFFRSTDRGESWEKRSAYVPGGPQYYNEIFADPVRAERVYSMDVFLKVTEDAGATFADLGETSKHVDNHALWIDPANTDHLLNGCDGGVYETFDRGATWEWKANLPTVQFYKVAVDDREPFYYVYGGTQDNFTLGGPSRTMNQHGILNQDWSVTLSGDGFQARVEPGNPDLVYAQAQNGNLTRIDLKTREETFIQPQAEPGEAPLRWNWDSPLILSPHAPARLYYAAQRLFRSDDRGDSWQPVSPDLTRQLDRNQLAVMGRIQRPEAVAKNASTSFYGNLVALAESPRVEGLLYLGSDDGLVQVSEDGGGAWRRIERFPGVPERAYVRELEPSRHVADRVYAAMENHKMGDFRPYLLASEDRGRSWRSISANLPERGSTYTLVEDPVDPDLLFAGTEFGLYASQDRGASWFRLKGGLPTIQVRDLAIQEREGDLVVATFGRGIFILDDLSPLRRARRPELDRPAFLFPVRAVDGFVPALPLGYRDKGFQGEQLYAAPNPPYGAVLTFHLKEEIRTRKKSRQEAEKAAEKEKRAWTYPTAEALRAEAAEEKPVLVLTIADAEGRVVRRLTAPAKAGVQRAAWDLRYPPADPSTLEPPKIVNAYSPIPTGPLAPPGEYSVSLASRIDGVETALAGPERFTVVPWSARALPAPDRAALAAFAREIAALQRAGLGASRLAGETAGRIALVRRALDDAGNDAPALRAEGKALEGRIREITRTLDGDAVLARRNEPTPPSITDRIQFAVAAHYSSTAAPTATARRQVEVAGADLEKVLAELRRLVGEDLPRLEAAAEAAGAPWTPGRIPTWPRETP
jgi:photosystem II stability/assembly factor-like uncharacterized protein